MEQMNKPSAPAGGILTEWLQRKAAGRQIPLNGTFELSPVCNFFCRMCYVRKTQKEVCESPRPILVLDDWRRIAREAREAGMLYLLLTGGEPLLWPDFWTLYEELVDMGFLISINTNGSLIDEEAVARFRKRPPVKISITLYGANDATYKRLCGVDRVFSKVTHSICRLKEIGISMKLNCSLTPENVGDMEQIVDFSKQHDIPLSVASYMFPPVRRDPAMVGQNERFTPEEAASVYLRWLHRDRGEEAYRQYLRQVAAGYTEPPGLDEGCIDPIDGRIRCRAGRTFFWITWDGWLTPCGMMGEPKIDLKNQTFSEAWQQLITASAALRLSGVCDKCSNRSICHPCAAIAYAETGSVGGIPTYQCRFSQEQCRIARETLACEDITENPAEMANK